MGEGKGRDVLERPYTVEGGGVTPPPPPPKTPLFSVPVYHILRVHACIRARARVCVSFSVSLCVCVCVCVHMSVCV